MQAAEETLASARYGRRKPPLPEGPAPQSEHRALLIAYFSMRYVLLPRLKIRKVLPKSYSVVSPRSTLKRSRARLLSASDPAVTAGKPGAWRQPSASRSSLPSLDDRPLPSVVASPSPYRSVKLSSGSLTPDAGSRTSDVCFSHAPVIRPPGLDRLLDVRAG